MNLLGVSGVYTAPDGSHHAALAMHTERHAMVVGYGSTSPHSFAPASRVGV